MAGSEPGIRWGRVLAVAALALAMVDGVLSLGFRYERAARAEIGGQTAVRAKYGEALDAVYADYSPVELNRLLEESWERPPRPHYVNLFREAPIDGEYVRVDPAGFRHVEDQAPWPPPEDALVVFLFGGSATFGYGVPNADTLPSVLQRQLRAELGERVAVYNFSRAFYFSSLELLLFLDLVERGHVPDVALFVDGYNDAYSADVRAPESYPGAVEAGDLEASLLRTLQARVDESALGELATRTVQRAAAALPRLAPAERTRPEIDAEAAVANVVGRLQRNHRILAAIGDALGVETRFVLHPIPGYRHDTTRHPFFGNGLERPQVFYGAYAALERGIAAGDFGADAVSCADVQEGAGEGLYVDLVHYARPLAERLAACIRSRGRWEELK